MSFFENLDFNPFDFWAVGAIVLMLLLWGIFALFGHKFRAWVVPTFCSIAILANVGTFFFLGGSQDSSIVSDATADCDYQLTDDGYYDAESLADSNQDNGDDDNYSETGLFEVTINKNNPQWGVAYASADLAERGSRVNLNAEPIEGYEFDRWEVLEGRITLNNVFSPNVSFTMPDNSVSVMAHFRMEGMLVHGIALDTNNPTYGTANTSSHATEEGQRIMIFAIANARYAFERWEVVFGDVTITDIYSATTYFMMPDGDVSIRANFISAPNAGQPSLLSVFEGNIENEINSIRAIWIDDSEAIYAGTYDTMPISRGITAIFRKNDLARIEIAIEADDFGYSRIYQFTDSSLQFAFISGNNEQNRLYFHDGTMFRWRHTPDTQYQDTFFDFDNEIHMMQFIEWSNFALSEAYYFYSRAVN